MSYMSIYLGYLLFRMLEEADGSSCELHGSQYVADESFVAEGFFPLKWCVLRLTLGLKQV